MNFNQSNFHILTGGPGSGKTSVLRELAARGYSTVPEVGRNIIQEQQKIGGSATHTGDRKAFRDLMLEQSIADYCKMCSAKNAVFFDRGIPDLDGYSTAFCDEISSEIRTAIKQFYYSRTVFIFPPWLEIYKNDTERQQDFQEAIKTYDTLKECYSIFGYTLVEVPQGTIGQRANFILQTLTGSDGFGSPI